MEILKEKDFYRCADLALIGVISLSYPIEAIDRDSKSSKAYFLFKRDQYLDQLLEAYWRGEIQVEPKQYFQQLKIIKTRLYEKP